MATIAQSHDARAERKPAGCDRSCAPPGTTQRVVAPSEENRVWRHLAWRAPQEAARAPGVEANPANASVQRKALDVSQPGDALELEADRIASEVVGSPGPAGGCQACGGAAAGGLQRKASGSAPRARAELPAEGGAGGLVSALGPGAELPRGEAKYFEPRLGVDLAGVRLHTGDRAAQAAAAVDAVAFTYGSNVVLGAEAPPVGSIAGRELLAHELVHVLQQTSQGATTPAPLQVARRGPMPRAVRRPPPIRVAPRTRAGTGQPSGSRNPEPAPMHQIYAPPASHDNSLHALMWRASERSAAERAIFQGERPFATLERGGSAPDFVSDAGQGQSMIGSGRVVTYRRRHYHVLDAIEYEVGRARSDRDLSAVLTRHLSDSWLTYGLALTHLLEGGSTYRNPALGGAHYFFRPYEIGPDLDPRAERRLQVFSRAVAVRLAAAPEMRRQPLARAIAENLLLTPPDERQGPCDERPVPRRGGHARHDAYATHVTGSGQDYYVGTPEGIACTFDGQDRHGQVWEVKTGYRYFSEAGIVWSPDVPRFHEMILGLEEQRMRCTFVASRCGKPYAYAFDDPEVAASMQIQWGGVPPVYHIQPP